MIETKYIPVMIFTLFGTTVASLLNDNFNSVEAGISFLITYTILKDLIKINKNT